MKQSGLIQFSNLSVLWGSVFTQLIVFIQLDTFPKNVDLIDIFNHTLGDFDAAGLWPQFVNPGLMFESVVDPVESTVGHFLSLS